MTERTHVPINDDPTGETATVYSPKSHGFGFVEMDYEQFGQPAEPPFNAPEERQWGISPEDEQRGPNALHNEGEQQ